MYMRENILTMEKKFEEYAMQNDTYKSLLDIYNLNKPMIAHKLIHSNRFYSQYSSHDESHTRKIIIAVERILGENGIKYLSATDIYVFLLSAYLHDYSMVLNYEEVYKLVDTSEFNDFLENLKSNVDFKKDIENIELDKTTTTTTTTGKWLKKKKKMIIHGLLKQVKVYID